MTDWWAFIADPLYATIIGVGIYIWLAFCLYRIAVKINVSDAWWSWIPFLNLVIVCRASDKADWYFLLFLVPILNIIVYADIWMTIAESRNLPSWTGVLMFFPVINFVMIGILAFYSPEF